MVTSFRELRVYQAAREGARIIFVLSRGWPREERYALTDQIRRSARSVSANVAEAWGKRRYPRHFVSKLTDATAEAAETQSWLDAALDAGLLDESGYERLDRHYDRLSAGLVVMMKDPISWCGPAVLAREPEAIYVVEGHSPHTPILPTAHPLA